MLYVFVCVAFLERKNLLSKRKKEGYTANENKKKALGLLIAAALLLPAVPVSAAEASSVGIVTGDQGLVTYTGPAEGQGQNGGTWSWDGAGTLTLNQYNGGRIYAEGDLTGLFWREPM